MTDIRGLWPGTLIGERYAIERALGAAGGGPVYRVVDRHLRRRATLRLFRSTEWPSADRERFQDDVRRTTPITHLNVAGIREFGVDAALDLGYVVYEPQNGATLGACLTDGPLPPSAVLRLLQDVVRGLGAAHRNGLVHGEIHPDTVFVAYNAVDRRLGVQLLLPGLPLTGLDEDAATARYAAPEVVSGESAPTTASDVYSLGVLAHDLLVGLPADWEDTGGGERPRDEAALPPVNQVDPEISKAVALALSGAARADPDLRFGDGNVFEAVLAHALDTSTVAPGLMALIERLPDYVREAAPLETASPKPVVSGSALPAVLFFPPERRGRRWVRVGAAVVLAGLGIGGTAWTLSSRDAVPAAIAAPAEAVALPPHYAPPPSDASSDSSAGTGAATASPEAAATVAPRPVPATRSPAPQARPRPEVIVIVAPESPEVEPLTLPSGRPAFEPESLPPLPVPDPSSAAPSRTARPAAETEAVYGMVHVDQPPTLLNLPRLQQELARLQRDMARSGRGPSGSVAGTVRLQFVVLANGRVDPATVRVLDDASRQALQEIAGEVMRLAEFTPGSIDGSPVNVRVQIELALSPPTD